jgi:hypothetical protein
MRTRIIVIGAFLCAAVLPAILAVVLYLQERHVPCRWSADYCSPLDNLIFAGAVVRGCAVTLIIVGLTCGALVYWRWRLHGTRHWSVILVAGAISAILVLGSMVIWALAQAALDTYAQLFNSVPAGAAKESHEAITFLNQLEGAMHGFIWLGRALVIIVGVAVTAYAFRIWHTFDIQERNLERALEYKYLPHKHH